MPNYTSPDRLPQPTGNERPRVQQLEDLAAATQAALTDLRDRAATNRTDLLNAISDARNSQVGTAVGTGSTTEVATGRQGIPGMSFDLPAGVGVVVTLTFDVTAGTRNGACVFEGRLNIIPLDNPSAADIVPRSATFDAGVAGGRATVTQTWQIGASNVGRRLQGVVLKSNPNAAFTVNNTNSAISWQRTRSGAL